MNYENSTPAVNDENSSKLKMKTVNTYLGKFQD